jgi:acyl-[acyl-carrier-protein]-phospholipid O-acyltransferase/long-chain-fatty-acid--[acyl-carrier-protein] ligase
MPLVQGIPMVCYPDPSNTLAVAKLIYRHNITLFCATSTFLSLYSRNLKIHPLMLSSLRIVVAGAEKLSLSVYEEFKKKFNLEIYEGYGATELSPVASCNLPDVLSPQDWHVHQANRPGTVGLPLPGTAFRVVDPESLQSLAPGEQGLILIGGTQVMRGYLNNPEKTKTVLIQEGDFTWYKTGDKGYIDSEGYLTIVDRYSRFAKIGGEMVGLGQLEEQVKKCLNVPDMDIMAIALPDSKKGERILVLYTGLMSPKHIKDALVAADIPKLMLPSELIPIGEFDLIDLPKLPTGKKDYVTAKKMLLEKVTMDEEKKQHVISTAKISPQSEEIPPAS